MDWARIEAVLDEALDVEPVERDALVRNRLGDDPALEREALSLLAAAETSSDFLTIPRRRL